MGDDRASAGAEIGVAIVDAVMAVVADLGVDVVIEADRGV